jgi:hypothetical protein
MFHSASVLSRCYVCFAMIFKCFSRVFFFKCFRRMFQVFYLSFFCTLQVLHPDVFKSRSGVAQIVMVIHAYVKCFICFQTYVVSV